MEKKEHRLNELLLSLKLNPKEFAESIGLKRVDRIYFVLKGRNDISTGLARIINNRYPNVNHTWLLTGEGEMFIENASSEKTTSQQPQLSKSELGIDNKTITISNSDIKEGNFTGTPVYDIDGTCGTDERDMQFTDDSIIGSVDLPEISKSSKIIRANGDSMEPKIYDGNKIVIREIFSWDDIFYGQVYLILMEEYRMIKYIRRYEKDEENYIILRSENSAYDDIKLHKSKILKLFIVENILSVKTQI